jgi:hydrogenase maturation protease
MGIAQPINPLANSMKTLVLGLGNPLLRDDSVGLRVAERLAALLEGRDHVVVDLDYWGGLRLMERMIGFDRAIVIDAICSGSPPGNVQLLHPNGVTTQRSASPHDMNLRTALELGRQAGASLPKDTDILFVAIEAADVRTFDEELSPEVEASIPVAVDIVMSHLAQGGGER